MSRERAEQLLAAIRKECETLGFECERAGSGNVATRRNVDQEALKADIDTLKAALALIPNTFPDREDYIRFGYAIKGATQDDPGAGFQLFLDWAAKWEGGNAPETVAADWERMRPPFELGADYIYGLAQRYGFNLGRYEFPAEPDNRPRPAVTLADLMETRHCHDAGNADKFMRLFGADVRYCTPMRSWFLWDGTRWRVDEAQKVNLLAKQAMVEALRQAINTRNNEAERFARQSLDARRLSALLSLAQAELPIRVEEMDANPWLINFRNGTLDLHAAKDGELRLREHRREDFITKVVTCDYDPNAQAPTFQKVLDRATRGSIPLKEYLQSALGYSMTGVTTDKAFFICYGPSGTGKTTLLNAVRYPFREYATTIQIETLMARREGLDNNGQADLADLRGVRFAQTSETEPGQRIREGQLKRLTQGGGVVKAVRKFEHPIQFPETHKLWMDANHQPDIRDGTGVWERLHCIPFPFKIPESEQDPSTHARLEAEAPGIASWVVQGAAAWAKAGRLSKPLEVLTANNAYRESQDTVGDWLGERCNLDASESASAGAVLKSYNDYATGIGERPIDAKRLKERLAQRGVLSKRRQGGMCYAGLVLHPPPQFWEPMAA